MAKAKAPRRGKHSFYPGKLTTPTTVNFTAAVNDDINLVGKRTGNVSRVDLLEHAWRRVRKMKTDKKLDALLRELGPPAAEA
jgi:hypothetical protein